MTWKTIYENEIHSAYKGGRVQTWKTGIIDKVNAIDVNSLYPYATTMMKYPDLRTEIKIYDEEKMDYNKIGISRAMLKVEDNQIGLLQIRTGTTTYTPTTGQYIIGTWTNMEIKEAINNGYKLITTEWMITWDEATNPFKIITPILYDKKKNSQNEVDYWFYKSMLNHSYGKMAQRRPRQIMKIDDVEKALEYIDKNYQMIKGMGTNIMYKKEIEEWKKKNYYAPIIPTLINAWSRIYLYKALKQIGIQKLIYCDTDGIKYEGTLEIKGIKTGNLLGEWKIEDIQKQMISYGTKTYSIGETIKISGFNQNHMTFEEFESGIVQTKKMITIKTAKKEEEIGAFKNEIRDLKEQTKNFWTIQKEFREKKIHVDKDIEDISYFMPHINYLEIN